MAQSSKFDVEATLAKLTMPQKIKLLAGLVCYPRRILSISNQLTPCRAGGILNLSLRLVYLQCA